MKNPVLYITALSGLLLASAQVSAAEESKVFAALAMTKAQKASPIPTDSGVFLYDAQSDDWERVGPVIQATNSLTVDPSDANTLFLACGNGIVVSRDGGESWRMTTGWRESDFTKIAVDPKNGDNVYAASVWGVSVSRDGGESWARANEGLAARFSRTIIVDHRKPKRLLLGTEDGIYESMNGAKSWKRVKSSPQIVILRIDRSLADPDIWIAGTEGKGVYISKDDGKSWTAVAPTLGEANIYAVAADPFDAKRLAVGGWDVGAWVSTDAGETWVERAEGLSSPNITSITYDPKHSGRVWVSTFEEGTLYSDNDGKTWNEGGLKGAYVLDSGFVPFN